MNSERLESTMRLVYSVMPALAAAGALAAVLVVPPLLDAAVPTRETAVAAGTHVTLTATGVGAIHAGTNPDNGVRFAVPAAMQQVATGDQSTTVLRSTSDNQRLAIQVVDGITDFDTAAPRLLLPLRAGGEQVDFDGGVVNAGNFQGLTCVLPDLTGGVCAVAYSGDVAVTVTVAGTTPEAGRNLINAVLQSAQAVQA
ncbi:hypothetical protein [Nocardia sp. NPDC020380]|uniref:hypothetical protein n=1 Tax=Nocardia sp. NPDC020380 TaxID=3364309 RepID=UPI0037B1F136